MLISFDKQLLRPVVCFVRRTIVVYTMGTEHVLATLRSVFVRASLPSKWTHKPPPLRPELLQLTGTIPVIYSSVRAALQRHGWLARPPSWPIHVSTLVYNAVADSVVINFSFTMVIINSTVDNPWHDISGEIHPIYFILHIAFFKRAITPVCKVV